MEPVPEVAQRGAKNRGEYREVAGLLRQKITSANRT